MIVSLCQFVNDTATDSQTWRTIPGATNRSRTPKVSVAVSDQGRIRFGSVAGRTGKVVKDCLSASESQLKHYAVAIGTSDRRCAVNLSARTNQNSAGRVLTI